jgi:hypothetical protein
VPRKLGARLHRGRRGAARTGTTLVELLVTATLLVVIVASLGTMLVGQFRLFGRTQAAVQVQRDLRTGLGLLPLDLRSAARTAGTATSSDLTLLDSTVVQLRATVGGSIICARPSATVVHLPPTGLRRNQLTSWYTQPRAGDTVLVYVDSTSIGPEDDRWQPMQIAEFAPATTCGGAPYVDPAVDPAAASRGWALRTTANLPPTAVVGAPLRFLRSVRYSLYQPGVGSQWYLGYREYLGGAWTADEPIAGPFRVTAAGARGCASSTSASPGRRSRTRPRPPAWRAST